jgi:hypothetical protein
MIRTTKETIKSSSLNVDRSPLTTGLSLGIYPERLRRTAKKIEPHEQFSATSGRSDDGHRNRHPPEL